MAKAGKPYFSLPEEFFQQAEAAYEEKLRAVVEAVAAKAGGETLVRMQPNKNGRMTAIVYLTGPDGLARQAKDGDLTRAAAGQGLIVERYREG